MRNERVRMFFTVSFCGSMFYFPPALFHLWMLVYFDIERLFQDLCRQEGVGKKNNCSSLARPCRGKK